MHKTIKRITSLFLAVLMFCGMGMSAMFRLDSSAVGYSVGDILSFGSYPQSEVKDQGTLAGLNGMSKSWTSYGYSSGSGEKADGQMAPADFMFYCDLEYPAASGQMYRAVFFREYRPSNVGLSRTEGNSYQDNNGYMTNTIYYFKYEPLHWRVLDPSTGLIVCESLIDAQPFQNFAYKSGGYWWNSMDCNHYSSDYVSSSIRKWLANPFYNTAFSTEQKSRILTTALENKSTHSDKYNCSPTNDKVFLLSYWDALNTQYGFSSSASAKDSNRIAKPTAYAKCMGVWVDDSSGASHWWLRTPYDYNFVDDVNHNGMTNNRENDYVTNTFDGIRPALRIDLNPTVRYTARWIIGSSVVTQSYLPGETIHAPQATPPDGYTFVGWSPSIPSTMPASDMTFTAVFSAIQYSLYFDANGGSGEPSTMTGATAYTIPSTVPVRSGYTFLGWSTNKNAVTATYQPGNRITLTSSMILYAVWEKIVYSVKLIVSDKTLTVAPGKTKEITISYEGSYPYDLGVSYHTDSENVIACRFGSWENNKIKLTVTGKAIGTETVTISLCDAETGETLDQAEVKVEVKKDRNLLDILLLILKYIWMIISFPVRIIIKLF